jgi:hypothetical protein
VDNVYGWEEVLALGFLICVTGAFWMFAFMALVVFLVALVILGVLFAIFCGKGFVQGFREGIRGGP